MLSLYCEKWKTELTTKPKLRTYVKLKENFGVEKYVQLNLSRSQRSLLAQIRMGILPLSIETGRYSKTKLEDRLCTLCNARKVENETHFLFNCNFYKTERSNFLQNTRDVVLTYSLINNFKILCNSHPRLLSKFINNIWTKRKDGMYKI